MAQRLSPKAVGAMLVVGGGAFVAYLATRDPTILIVGIIGAALIAMVAGPRGPGSGS